MCDFRTAQNGLCSSQTRGGIVARSEADFLRFVWTAQFWGCGPPKVTQHGSGHGVLVHSFSRKRGGSYPWISEKRDFSASGTICLRVVELQRPFSTVLKPHVFTGPSPVLLRNVW